MPIQSSFLIRCWLDSLDSTAAIKRFHVEHVQTGRSCYASSFAEILLWLDQVNQRLVADSANAESNELGGC